MFHVTHKVKQIKRLVTSSVKNNRTHTSEDANQFSDCRWTHSSPILNERGHPASVVELAENLYVFGVCPIHLCWINMRGGSGQSIHPILFVLSVLIDTTSPAPKGVSLQNHKVLVHSTSIRVINASLMSS